MDVKRRVFISHYGGDRAEVDAFIKHFANTLGVFTPYVLGANDNDEFIDSTDTDYVMQRIRKLYLKDSTITILLIGSCTHSRRYVDWELKSSLRQSDGARPNGLIGILLPSQGNSAHLPNRFQLNWSPGNINCYARYHAYPKTERDLRSWIEDAYQARTSRSDLIANPQEVIKYNRKCKVHNVTH